MGDAVSNRHQLTFIARRHLHDHASNLKVGAVAGHIYYFLMDVWPREMWYPGASKVEKGNVKGPIKAPRWM